MKVKQLSIFLENKTGRLLETAEALANQEINIRALSIAETSGFGVARLIVENTDMACKLLKMHEFTVEITEVIAIEVDDKPGRLAYVLKVLNENKLNIEYCYAFVERNQDKAVIIAKIEDLDKAIETLQKNSIKVLTQDELYK